MLYFFTEGIASPVDPSLSISKVPYTETILVSNSKLSKHLKPKYRNFIEMLTKEVMCLYGTDQFVDLEDLNVTSILAPPTIHTLSKAKTNVYEVTLTPGSLETFKCRKALIKLLYGISVSEHASYVDLIRRLGRNIEITAGLAKEYTRVDNSIRNNLIRNAPHGVLLNDMDIGYATCLETKINESAAIDVDLYSYSKLTNGTNVVRTPSPESSSNILIKTVRWHGQHRRKLCNYLKHKMLTGEYTPATISEYSQLQATLVAFTLYSYGFVPALRIKLSVCAQEYAFCWSGKGFNIADRMEMGVGQTEKHIIRDICNAVRSGKTRLSELLDLYLNFGPAHPGTLLERYASVHRAAMPLEKSYVQTQLDILVG